MFMLMVCGRLLGLLVLFVVGLKLLMVNIGIMFVLSMLLIGMMNLF